ncbi:MAG: histidine kinase [Defluviitaleaceae bacterium]|nr:histidine kinase [Defluviitaleaceae bacterium]
MRDIPQKQLILIMVLFTALILGLWFGYSAVTYASLRQNATENVQLTAERLISQVSAEFSQMNTIAGVIAGSSTVQDFLLTDTTATFFAGAESASEIIRNAIHPHSFVDSVITFDNAGNFFRFTGGLSNAACEALHDMVYGVGSLQTIIELDGVLFFMHSAPVYSILGQRPFRVGAIVLLTHLDRTRVALVGSSTVPNIDTAVIQDDTILLSSNMGLEGSPDAELYEIYGLVSRMHIAGTNLSVAAAVKSGAIFPGRPLFLAASFVLLAIMLLSVRFLYTTLTRRQKLFNAELVQKDMRISLLTTQIDAHFLVNTITSIRTLSMQSGNESAGRMADGLAQLIQHRHNGDELCNIFFEFEMLERYVDIMNIRHGNKFIAEYDVDDSLAAYLMPGLILQPIVENALTHGLQNKDGEGVLQIRGYMRDAVLIEISDNGAGIEPLKLDEIRGALDATNFGNFPEPGLSGVALCNVHRRIRLRFGHGYGLAVDSTPGGWTTVTVKLPATPDINA